MKDWKVFLINEIIVLNDCTFAEIHEELKKYSESIMLILIS